MSHRVERIAWRHGDSRAEFSLDALPLVIGTVAAADIRIAGPGGQTLAQIDVIDGQPIVQPLFRPSPMQLDGDTLAGSRTLRDGQTLAAHGVEIDLAIDDEGCLTLSQHSRASLFETLPPEVEPVEDDAPIVAETWQTAQAPAATSKRRWLWPVMGLALAGLAFSVFWLTTSVALRLETTPATPDAVFIEGPGPAIRIGERWLVRRGVHRFVLKSEGWLDLDRSIDVDGRTSTLVLTQQPLPGELQVITDAPADAPGQAVLVDGEGNEYRADLPAAFDGLLPGSYELRVEQAGFLPWSDLVTVAGLGRTQTLDVDLVPAFGRVTFATDPAGASVSSLESNTTLAEATPAAVDVPAGRQRLLFALDGYKPVERSYVVFANTAVEAAPIVLEPADAQLTVTSSPAGASVTLDGRYQGRTPLTLALEPDQRYELRLTRTGYASQTRRVSLPAATSRRMAFDLDARTGELTIRAVPSDAEILINGRVAGRGTVEVALPAEPQRISVRKPGYVTAERGITPRPGFAQTVDIRLQSEEAARLARIQQQITVGNDHRMRYFRGGTFQRGTSRREPDRRSNETLVDIRITRPFYLGVHEVTNAQFAEFRSEHVRGGDVYASIAGDNNPVVNVSWQDAAAYCNWLSQRDGLDPAYVGEFGKLVAVSPVPNGYRLPSEAEWVWAARYAGQPGTPRRFGWGASMPPDDKVANLADESASELVGNFINGFRDGFPATAPVGSFAGNAAGIHDLDGNVAEWVHDVYAASPSSDGPQVDPFGPASGANHVIRGPGWRDANPQRLRLAYRGFGDEAEIDVGFRVARFATDADRSAQ